MLNSISFSSNKGDIINILGENGAGKTTLFKCIINNIKYEGTCEVNNKNLKYLRKSVIGQLISYVPSEIEFNFNYKVLDVVLMGFAPKIGFYGFPKEKEIKKAKEILSNLSIYNLKDRGFLSLSSGQKKLVLIAKALVLDTDIIILDEPFINLDFKKKIIIVKEIKKLSKNGKTIILSIHEPTIATYIGGKTLIIKNGTVFKYGKTEEIINSNNLSKLYNINIKVKYFENNGSKIGFCFPKY